MGVNESVGKVQAAEEPYTFTLYIIGPESSAMATWSCLGLANRIGFHKALKLMTALAFSL